MEYESIIKSTNDLSKNEIEKIIYLKMQFWDYSFNKQKIWFENNINEDDLHFLVFNDDRLLAYLNAIKTYAIIDGKKINIIGIGNVCVDSEFQKNGIGHFLMRSVNNYLISNSLFGMLLCKDNLIDFYKKLDWVLLHPQQVAIGEIEFYHNVMAYQMSNIASHNISKIEIERNF